MSMSLALEMKADSPVQALKQQIGELKKQSILCKFAGCILRKLRADS